jgi:hypothetical protein
MVGDALSQALQALQIPFENGGTPSCMLKKERYICLGYYQIKQIIV